MNTSVITPPAHTGDRVFDGVFPHSLGFRVEMDYEAARQFVRRIGGYNAFDPDRVLAALDAVDALIPRKQYGPGNPNNGSRDFTIAVGREGSPVIYLERIELYGRDRMTDGQMRNVCRAMRETASADEADYHIEPFECAGGRKITFRFWWD